MCETVRPWGIGGRRERNDAVARQIFITPGSEKRDTVSDEDTDQTVSGEVNSRLCLPRKTKMAA